MKELTIHHLYKYGPGNNLDEISDEGNSWEVLEIKTIDTCKFALNQLKNEDCNLQFERVEGAAKILSHADDKKTTLKEFTFISKLMPCTNLPSKRLIEKSYTFDFSFVFENKHVSQLF